ncbi:MAG TPA: DUF550 domain-containing protein [Desulfobacterales bacterium]|nr:DUF550 domain-containing protein [Desulfobacterales bacterium]
MKNIANEIIEWHRGTFPNATEKAILLKLTEESEELIKAIENDTNIIEEIADVVIVAVAFLARRRLWLEDVVSTKLDINKSRKWGDEDENGDRPRVKMIEAD